MRRPVVVKRLSARAMLRKSALSATAASRRSFPAWIDANEHGVAFSARVVTPRVRDGLVLRTVLQRKAAKGKGATNANRAR
jgi:hypothetical protein